MSTTAVVCYGGNDGDVKFLANCCETQWQRSALYHVGWYWLSNQWILFESFVLLYYIYMYSIAPRGHIRDDKSVQWANGKVLVLENDSIWAISINKKCERSQREGGFSKECAKKINTWVNRSFFVASSLFAMLFIKIVYKNRWQVFVSCPFYIG